jgi:energy-coupling factor transporter transmembrane protein EcfT
MAQELAFEYTPGAGPLHRLHPFIKLLLMAAVSIGALQTDLTGQALMSIAICVSARIGGISVRKLLAGARSILITTVFIVGLSALNVNPIGFNPEALRSGLQFIWAIGISFSMASLFFYTTKLNELRDAIESVETRLPWFRSSYLRFSLLFSLTLGFIPRVFYEWSEAEDAWLARGGKRGISMMIHVIPSVLERLILSAKETAHALELRLGR